MIIPPDGRTQSRDALVQKFQGSLVLQGIFGKTQVFLFGFHRVAVQAGLVRVAVEGILFGGTDTLMTCAGGPQRHLRGLNPLQDGSEVKVAGFVMGGVHIGQIGGQQLGTLVPDIDGTGMGAEGIFEIDGHEGVSW